MSNVFKCQMLWNVNCHEMSNVMKRKISCNVKCHEVSNVMKCQMSWSVKCHIVSNVIECQMSWSVKGRQMANVILCQMFWQLFKTSLNFWHFIGNFRNCPPLLHVDMVPFGNWKIEVQRFVRIFSHLRIHSAMLTFVEIYTPADRATWQVPPAPSSVA